MSSSVLAFAGPHLHFWPTLCLLALGAVTAARADPVGVFEDHGDIGAVRTPGSLQYDPKTQEYRLSASGDDMWNDHDQFQFAWKRVKGDFVLQAGTAFVGQSANPHRKLGLIVRTSLDSNSPHVNAARHGGGLLALQYRRLAGGPTEEIHLKVEGADTLQLERIGRTFRMSAARFGDLYTTQDLDGIDLPDEVYVGIYVCADDNSKVEQGVFRNVRLIKPAAPDFKPYRAYIGSDLELLNVETGARRVIYHVDDSLQAPNWTPDNHALIVNRNGRMYRFDFAQGQPTEIDTGDEIHNNNDHALSADGKTLGISSGSPSRVHTLPIGGGAPYLVTPTGPSYLHGFSPDGKSLLFTGQRNDNFDIYKVPVTGGPEERLTTARGLNDGAEFTPDGKTIFFISDRTGKMQIWKMDADGTNQTQVTFDEYNNWFPHVSPDGRTIVFLSFRPEIAANDHPFYKHVYLRMMPVTGGAPRVVAYFYGGQGSINVNSWSPDSTQVGFVSNSGAF